jgi:chromosome segregation and condensation protein ScpB
MTGGKANIERLLRAHPDGLTTRQMAEALGITKEQARSAMKGMPHVYIDRWIALRTGAGGCIHWAAIYMLADLPEDMPKPNWTPTDRDL